MTAPTKPTPMTTTISRPAPLVLEDALQALEFLRVSFSRGRGKPGRLGQMETADSSGGRSFGGFGLVDFT